MCIVACLFSKVRHVENARERLRLDVAAPNTKNAPQPAQLPFRCPQNPTGDGDAPLQELEEKAARHDISRLPVFDSQRKNIIGIVNVFDHLFEEEKGERVSDLLRTAPSLAQNDGIYAALVCLRRARMPMGIVRDDATQAVGIVTVKDLVEEIVGKLEAF